MKLAVSYERIGRGKLKRKLVEYFVRDSLKSRKSFILDLKEREKS